MYKTKEISSFRFLIISLTSGQYLYLRLYADNNLISSIIRF